MNNSTSRTMVGTFAWNCLNLIKNVVKCGALDLLRTHQVHRVPFHAEKQKITRYERLDGLRVIENGRGCSELSHNTSIFMVTALYIIGNKDLIL